MRKILFIDVDGTLVDYENNLPQSAVDAIRTARANGHLVFICTGRSRAEVYQNIWDIGLDGMIGGNGSYVEYHGQVLLHQMLSYEQCVEIVDWLHEKNLAFYLESNSGLYASESFEVDALDAIREYSKRKGKTFFDIAVRDVFPDMIFDGELYRDDVNKISYALRTYQDFVDTKEHFADLQNGTWGGVGETALFGDIGVKDITKAYAISALLKHLHASVEDTIAFGDAKVDIPMFEACAYGVAMGNGGPEIKKCADYITDDVDADGLAHAFAHLDII
ncbi:MAG: HAD family hydrolase [Wujia sp.]